MQECQQKAEEIPLVTSLTNVSGEKSKPGVNYKLYHKRLLKYLEEGNFRDFQNLLQHKDKYNINHVYGGTCYKTCLAEASEKGRTEFIEALLNNGADPNFVCSFHFGRAAIHFAAKEGHIGAIECLVEHPPTQKNAIDRHGDTALHLIASNLTAEGKNAEACFFYLAKRQDIDVRHRNVEGLSAISMAVGKCGKDVWPDVLRRRDLRPEDMQLILDKYPEFQEDNRETIESIYTHDDAYTDLRNKNFERFEEEFKPEFVNETELIETTFLQLACKEGYPDIVKLLLDCGADVNKTGAHEERPPVYLACYCGQYDILVRLFETNKVQVGFVGKEEKSFLHGVVQGLRDNKTPTDGYRKCFDYLLHEQSQITVSQCRKNAHTALHYACEVEDDYEYYTKNLVNHKAFTGYLNKLGSYALRDIRPQTLEVMLDYCVECKDLDNQCILKFNFNMLKPTETCDTTEQTKDAESGNRHQKYLPEMWPLYLISRSNKFEHLLKHPVLLLFLHLKWTRICMLFYMNMIYYITFVIFLTAHVLSESYSPGKCNGNSEQSVVWFILFFLTVILVARELIQFCLLPKKWRYFCTLDNILEVCIIAATIVIVVGTDSKLLMAVTLLLAWMEVILQLGCIYSLAVYNEMMKRVTLNYVKFLFWYLPLILAFSFSFHILYHKEYTSEGNGGTFYVNRTGGNFSIPDDNVDFYGSISLSLLKTAVMMIGEFDASSMSFDNGSYFVFLFFVFMMTIVLMNLLNGLAVSDTQAIKNDAELVAYKSKVKLLYRFESVVFGGPFNRSRCKLTGGSPSLLCPRQRRVQEAISLFPDTLSDGRLNVFLNHGTRYTNLKTDKDEEFRPHTCCRIGKYRMGIEVDREVFIAAKNIADKRTKQSPPKKCRIESRITRVEEGLQGCMKQLANLEGLLKQLVNNK